MVEGIQRVPSLEGVCAAITDALCNHSRNSMHISCSTSSSLLEVLAVSFRIVGHIFGGKEWCSLMLLIVGLSNKSMKEGQVPILVS